MKHTLTLLLAVGALSAAASTAAADCRTGDWYTTGYEDGALGRPLNYIRGYFPACRERGVRPNIRVWRQARQDGLSRYCTPQTAFELGQRGRGFAPACDRNTRQLTNANDRGLKWHKLNRKLKDHTREWHRANLKAQKARKLGVSIFARRAQEDADALLFEIEYIKEVIASLRP